MLDWHERLARDEAVPIAIAVGASSSAAATQAGHGALARAAVPEEWQLATRAAAAPVLGRVLLRAR